jgi:hypothetical protein
MSTTAAPTKRSVVYEILNETNGEATYGKYAEKMESLGISQGTFDSSKHAWKKSQGFATSTRRGRQKKVAAQEVAAPEIKQDVPVEVNGVPTEPTTVHKKRGRKPGTKVVRRGRKPGVVKSEVDSFFDEWVGYVRDAGGYTAAKTKLTQEAKRLERMLALMQDFETKTAATKG